MRTLIVIACLLLFCSSSWNQSSQASAYGSHPVSVSAQGELQVTTSIVRQRYCSDGMMLLDLRLTYRNIGNHNLILFKHAPGVTGYMVSSNLKAARAEHYEQRYSPMQSIYYREVKLTDEPAPSLFVILKPGQTYEPENIDIVLLFIEEIKEHKCDGCLRSGEHVMQVAAMTWPFRSGVEGELQARWKPYGDLWTSQVRSLPMPFKIDRPDARSVLNCNSPAQSTSQR